MHPIDTDTEIRTEAAGHGKARANMLVLTSRVYQAIIFLQYTHTHTQQHTQTQRQIFKCIYVSMEALAKAKAKRIEGVKWA